MLKFLKKKKQPENAQPADAPETPTPSTEQIPEKKGLFTRLRRGLSRTRHQLRDGLANIILGKKEIDQALFQEIETQLLLADVGIDVTEKLIKRITEQVSRKELRDPQMLYQTLKENLTDILAPCTKPLHLPTEHKPAVILMVGINGAGKTTTIGKLTKRLQAEGKSVMLAAGDTFRAAAIEQLQVWGDRNNVPVIAQQAGSDSASVIFDALQAAKARQVDVLIADTAGRLHTQQNLMKELSKIKRVMSKIDETAPHEVMLVLDATTGQNALQQAKQFYEAVEVSGITITKLDGTAKGGIIFAIADQLKTPIRFIGVGESIEDLQVFDSEEFIQALFNQPEGTQTDD